MKQLPTPMNEATREGAYFCRNLGEMLEAEAAWLSANPKALIHKRRPWNVDPKIHDGCAVRIDIIYILKD